MTKDEFCIELRAHIARKYITRRAAARAWKVSEAFVSHVVLGSKPATEVMLEDIGYERIKPETHYRKLKTTKEQSK